MQNQMINYFNTQSSLSSFQFQFDPERWIQSASDLNVALKVNKNLLDNEKASWNKFYEKVNSTKFKNQFKAYFAESNDMSDFEYINNPKKTQNATLIMEKFETIFATKA